MSLDTLPHTSFSLIRVRQLKGEVMYARPEITPGQAQAKIAEWVGKQGKHWSESLTAEYLTANLQIIHIPHLILDGEGSGQWSAQIGHEISVKHKCNTCNGTGIYYLLTGKSEMCTDCGGKGYQLRTETQWQSQTGLCSGSISREIEENFSKVSLPPLHCGKRSMKAVKLPSPPLDNLLFSPVNVSTAQGESLALQMIERSLSRDADRQSSRMGQVRGLRTVTTQTRGVRAVHWLYPFYVATFLHDNQAHVVQMDAITGAFHVQVPSSIQSARMRGVMGVIAPIALIMMIIFAVIFGWNTLSAEKGKIEGTAQRATQQALEFLRTQTQRPSTRSTLIPTRQAAAIPGVRFSNIQIASGVKSADGCAADSRNDFLETQTAIYLTAKAFDLPKGAQISAVWMREGKIVHRSNMWVVPQDYREICVWDFVEPSVLRFTPGQWTAQFALNGTPIGESRPFNIRARITATPSKTPLARAVTPAPTSILNARMQIIGGNWKRDPSGEISGNTSNGDGLLLFEEAYTDFTLSAEVRSMDREASFALRMQDKENGYVVVLAPANARGATPGVHLVRRVNGKEENLKSTTANLPQRGQWATLRVSVVGNRIKVYLNSRLMIDYTDPSLKRFSQGKVGLRIYGDTRYPCNANFRKIDLRAGG